MMKICQNLNLFHMGEAEFDAVQDFQTIMSQKISNKVTKTMTMYIMFETLFVFDYLEFQ